MSKSPLLSFYGDDLTGSTDAMEVLALAGVPTVLFLEAPTPEQLANFPHCRAIGVAGTSRAQSPDWMARELPPVFAALRELGAPICHYKTCSTFDSAPEVGNIGRAIEIGQAVFRGPYVPLVIGVPTLARYTLFGHLFATLDGTTYRIDRHPVMSRHPVTPMSESEIGKHLAAQSDARFGLVDILALRGPASEAALDACLRDGAEIVLFDVLEEGDLARIGRLLGQRLGQGPIFAAGSSGLEYALVKHWLMTGDASGKSTLPPAGPVERLAAVSGSCSPVTEEQILAACDDGFVGIAVDAAALTAPETALESSKDAIERALEALKRGRSVIVYSALGRRSGFVETRDLDSIAFNHRLGSQLGMILRELVAREKLSRVVVAGGDTSGHAARQLGLFAFTLRMPISPGAPLCLGHAVDRDVDGLEIALKGGQVGGTGYFRQVLDGTA